MTKKYNSKHCVSEQIFFCFHRFKGKGDTKILIPMETFNPHHKKFRSRLCRHWLKGHCRLCDKCNFAHGYDEVMRFSPKNQRKRHFIFADVSIGEEIRQIGAFSPDSVMAHFSIDNNNKEKEENEQEPTNRYSWRTHKSCGRHEDKTCREIYPLRKDAKAYNESKKDYWGATDGNIRPNHVGNDQILSTTSRFSR